MSIHTDLDHDDIMYPDLVPFLAVHAGCVAAIWSGVTWQAIAICAVLYGLRMFAITGGYHRYFSHRAYSTSRVSLRMRDGNNAFVRRRRVRVVARATIVLRVAIGLLRCLDSIRALRGLPAAKAMIPP